MDKETEKISESIGTIKIMIYSLYKSITGDDELENIAEWEKQCREIAIKTLKKQKDDSNKEN